MNIHQTILEKSKSKVMSGAFSGMFLDTSAVSWGDGDISKKLLGIYEEELNDIIEKFVGSNPNRIVNLGCAEGYYAVGMKIRCPNAQVFAVDISDKALNCTLINANLNNISLNLKKQPPNPNTRDLWIIDIEGGEFQMLDNPEVWKGVDIIVEMHEWTNRYMRDIFKSKFEQSHKITMINQGSRNPNKFEFLRHFSDHDRWLLMSENRPEMMTWMIFESKMKQ